MFVFPPWLPRLVPVNGEATPAAVMSLKLTFVSDTTAAVKVLVVFIVSDCIKSLLTALLPVNVKVPVTVWLVINCKTPTLLAGPFLVKFAKVFAPLTIVVPVPVSTTLLYV